MNEWEAKYKALAAGVKDPKLIENAELIVKDAIEISNKSGVSLEWVLDGILQKVAKRSQLLNFPIIVGDWLPANKAMIFGSFGAVITDLQTGECKVASKEDLKKVLRNITKNV